MIPHVVHATEMDGYLLTYSRCNLNKKFGMESAENLTGIDGSNDALSFFIRNSAKVIKGFGFNCLQQLRWKSGFILIIEPFSINRMKFYECILSWHR